MKSVTNIKSAQEFLKEYFYNDPKYDDFINKIAELSEYHQNMELENLEEELQSIINQTYDNLIIHCEDDAFNLSLRISLECVLFDNLHDDIMPLIYDNCKNEDLHLYEKCMHLSEKNVTAEQFGAKEDYGIPLYAGIVELASLDNRKSPIEKIICICTTYDLIYAELKSCIAEFLSETSDLENDIPIVDNSDIIPVLMTVIVKAKQLHMYSNLYYLNMFLWTTSDPMNIHHILSMFATAIDQISITTDESLRPSSAKNCKELDLKTTFEIINEFELEPEQKRKSETLLDIQRRKIAKQLQKATDII